jgi:hypothetical protein
MWATAALATTVFLKDGRTVEGEIVKRTDLEVRVKTADGKVVVLRRSEIERIDEKGPDVAAPKETGDAPTDRRTKEYERLLAVEEIPTAPDGFVVVRGHHPYGELVRMAALARRTAQHFFDTFGCRAEEVLRGEDRYGPAKIEIFQYLQEGGYLAFCDKVLDRIRDETVSSALLAFMRRQRGFWIVSPRPLMAQYQGPSDFVTSLSAACHKTSHILLTSWKPSGSFMPWWLYEGLASWQEFAVLDETRTYCLELAKPADYARPGTKEADEAAKARTENGWRGKVKSMVGRRAEKDLPVLGKMPLNDLVFEDVQQSWSVVDWLGRTGRLREFVSAYKDKRDLDAACRAVLGVPTTAVHEQWRQWVLQTY